MNGATTRETGRLIAAAVSARTRAYCPYSDYPVGAAVLTSAGALFSGCNVENASYGLAVCAERVAVFHAIAAGHSAIKAAAVVAVSAKPCGACRQVLAEFCDADAEIFLVDLDPKTKRRTVTRATVSQLLPLAFNPHDSGLRKAGRRGRLARRTH